MYDLFCVVGMGCAGCVRLDAPALRRAAAPWRPPPLRCAAVRARPPPWRAGFIVVRDVGPVADEVQRQRAFEKVLDAAATSPFARLVPRWVVGGAGAGARVAAVAGARARSSVAGEVLLAYPLAVSGERRAEHARASGWRVRAARRDVVPGAATPSACLRRAPQTPRRLLHASTHLARTARLHGTRAARAHPCTHATCTHVHTRHKRAQAPMPTIKGSQMPDSCMPLLRVSPPALLLAGDADPACPVVALRSAVRAMASGDVRLVVAQVGGRLAGAGAAACGVLLLPHG